MNRIYASIDLKSFYASVECRERNLDPLTTNLVVADESRTEKTVCLAITPALKQYGIGGRARLFEVNQKVQQINNNRKIKAKGHEFEATSYNDIELKKNPNLKLDFITAMPRMALYMKYSTDIFNIYLKYISPEDIFAYSVDEVFCDITDYLNPRKMNAKEFVTMMIKDVYNTTGITATAGIGTNLYLAKIAMDIGAKHIKPNSFGVRIAVLDEISYRKLLWSHRPLTDFWRVGKGYAKKLEEHHLFTMGDIARCSIENEDLLYKLFGVNAELLIDHSWGWECCTIKSIKEYKPSSNSLSSGQVLHEPYNYEKTKLIIEEMTDALVLDLVDKGLVTDQIVLEIGYDVENLTKSNVSYNGEIKKDRYGRNIPKHAHGTINLEKKTSSTRIIMDQTIKLFDNIIDKNLLVRRINITANKVIHANEANVKNNFEQIDLFTNYAEREKEEQREEKENHLQHAMIDIQKKFGKNAIIKGMNLQEGSTMMERNEQIGGHRK